MVGPKSRRHDAHGEWLWRLHEEHYDRMVRFSQRALALGAWADAEDVVQSVFTEAAAICWSSPWVVLDEAWLMRRLRSRIQDCYRRRSRELRLVEAVARAEPPASVEDIVTSRARLADLLACIPDPNDRLTLLLKLDGYREADIAERLGVSYEGRQVRDRMRRVRRQLACWRNPEQCAAEA